MYVSFVIYEAQFVWNPLNERESREETFYPYHYRWNTTVTKEISGLGHKQHIIYEISTIDIRISSNNSSSSSSSVVLLKYQNCLDFYITHH